MEGLQFMNKFNKLYKLYMEEVSTHLEAEGKIKKTEENNDSNELTECCDIAAGIDVGSVMRTTELLKHRLQI